MCGQERARDIEERIDVGLLGGWSSEEADTAEKADDRARGERGENVDEGEDDTSEQVSPGVEDRDGGALGVGLDRPRGCG